MNLTPKDNPEAFNRFLFEKIDLELYQHKFLNDCVDKARNGQKPIYDLSIINTSSSGWILIIHSEMLLVYGYNWSTDQIQEISEVFDLNIYTNYTIAGDDELIDELIKFYEPKNYEIEKRRLFYRATKINIFNNENLKIRLGALSDLDELAVMLQEYYHEEYNGLNDKVIEEMQQRIFSLIQTNNIYVLLKMNGELSSFCTVIDPDIGILFTKKECRNKGYGKVILSYCSSILQQKNDIVYLMTDRDKIESNIVCEAVGFTRYYKYKMAKINQG